MSVASLGFPGGASGKEFASTTGDPGSTPGLGVSLRGEYGNPPQSVFLPGESHGHRVAQTQTWLKQLSVHAHTHIQTHTHTHDSYTTPSCTDWTGLLW